MRVDQAVSSRLGHEFLFVRAVYEVVTLPHIRCRVHSNLRHRAVFEVFLFPITHFGTVSQHISVIHRTGSCLVISTLYIISGKVH